MICFYFYFLDRNIFLDNHSLLKGTINEEFY